MIDMPMEFPFTVETQADFDRLVGERVAREREKFADYDQLKEQNTKLVNDFEAEKQAREAAEQWKTDREARDAYEAERAEVAKAAGLPADVLRGADRAELEAHAEALKALVPQGDQGNKPPIVHSLGNQPEGSPGLDDSTELMATAAKLFGSGG